MDVVRGFWIAFVVVYKWSAFLEFLVSDSKKDSYLYWIEIIVEDYRPLKRIV
ncbi:hypothetical protein LEP1GSC045_4366 [Leptospira interrogans serovar Pomona str. Kennewicki LC82-25]|uniref:Uncharacterized protein n=1 Tax=Leptospira interrogans str. UI 12758 TaxID=1049938 RepID=A0A0E2D1D3_LEPIR|nr:hypothetical protein LEP1GSC045_4366 [Leptospira interrogans serovar Pomona str. Kennewicki LC82-25]EKN96779.1 hypothetical protein LEP1GSC014_1234 [Leptospira interrogans serovar Pomona str. Pomona]EKO71478.1 hypothetical protein LEP1GSC069_3428 [Leptospira interrogans serovar Canicola str. Fiocruz LV133]EKR53395.1 hypothetical protein LEP1GSC105_4770 [Leptospira interrogans str. UI 12758]EKR83016.1 hypothetical protein LEP1GSC099_4270 [Leptospira interrogans str. UI 08452]EMF35050.1 hypot